MTDKASPLPQSSCSFYANQLKSNLAASDVHKRTEVRRFLCPFVGFINTEEEQSPQRRGRDMLRFPDSKEFNFSTSTSGAETGADVGDELQASKFVERLYKVTVVI